MGEYLMVKVSVIMPVYNVEKYLRQCLDSLLNQTLQEFEIICVDDGSKDASLAILQEYQQKDYQEVLQPFLILPNIYSETP